MKWRCHDEASAMLSSATVINSTVPVTILVFGWSMMVVLYLFLAVIYAASDCICSRCLSASLSTQEKSRNGLKHHQHVVYQKNSSFNVAYIGDGNGNSSQILDAFKSK